MKNNIIIGAILCTIASASWGAMFPVANHAFNYIDPFYFTIIRYLPVAIILCIVLYLREGRKAFNPEGGGVRLWFYGTMGFTVYNLLIFFGQDMLGDDGVLLASVMEALAPTLSILILWFMHKNRPSLFTIICIIGSFIGVLLVVTNGNFGILFGENRIVPLLILLIAALGWAFYTIGGSVFPSWSVLRYSALSCLYGTITATVVVFILTLVGFVEIPTLADVSAVRYNMLFMIFVPGLLALIFWNQGVLILKPINAILFINFAPVTTIIIRAFQGYTISFFEIAGVAIVCLMIIFNNVYQRVITNRTSQIEEKYDNETKDAATTS